MSSTGKRWLLAAARLAPDLKLWLLVEYLECGEGYAFGKVVRLPSTAIGSTDRALMHRRAARYRCCLMLVPSLQCRHRLFAPKDLRESIATSCTVVIGPSSGTLAFRRRLRLCSLIRIRSPGPLEALSAFSPFLPMARAKACSGSRDLAGAEASFSFGKSWYFLSG